MVFLSESMRSRLSKSESNVFRNILVMPKSEIIKKYLKNVCINSLGTEISQNHLIILKWSLNKYWSWKVWILSFQTPYRTSSYHSWMSFYSCVYSSSKMSQKPLGMKIPSRPTLLMISYILPITHFGPKFTPGPQP